MFALSWAAINRCLDSRQWPRAAQVSLVLLLTGAYSTSAALDSAMGGRINAAIYEKATSDESKRTQAAYEAAAAELAILVVNAPPNLFAYGTETLEARDFVCTGLVLTVIAFLLVMLFCAAYWRWLDYV